MFHVVTNMTGQYEVGFYLIKDNWDDYRFKTTFVLFYIDEDSVQHRIGSTKIGYINQGTGYTSLPDQFEGLAEVFFSLGQEVEFYHNLKELGSEVRESCLQGLNDLAFDFAAFSKVDNEVVLKRSLMRWINVKMIRNQFSRVAHGGAILTDYQLQYKPETSKGSFQFNVTRDVLPPTNIHAIIGTNGAGKTTTLKAILHKYFHDELEEEFSNAIFISFSVFDKGTMFEREKAEEDFHYIGVKKEGENTKSHQELKKEFAVSIYTILSKKRLTYLADVLDVLNSDYNLKSIGFMTILNVFIDSSRDKEAMSACSKHFSEKFDLLSSGHQIILMSMMKIVELIVEKTLILIDEPESHLHPPLLSAFIRALSDITIKENAMAILATHSPVVLQEVPKSCVSIIRKYGEEMKIQRPRFETFGENIAVLTEEVFGLEIPKTGFHTLLKQEVMKNPVYEDIVELFQDELSIEAKSIIRTYINEINKEEED